MAGHPWIQIAGVVRKLIDVSIALVGQALALAVDVVAESGRRFDRVFAQIPNGVERRVRTLEGRRLVVERRVHRQLTHAGFVERDRGFLNLCVAEGCHLADGSRHLHRLVPQVRLFGGNLQLVYILPLPGGHFDFAEIHAARRFAIDLAVPLQLFAEAHGEFSISYAAFEGDLQIAIGRLAEVHETNVSMALQPCGFD